MKKIFPFALCMSFGSSVALADLSETLADVEFSGFFSLGAAWSDVDMVLNGIEPTYISFIRQQPSFDEDSNIGIQLTKPLAKEVEITVQLYAEGSNNFDVQARWAFLEWNPDEHWSLRAGRVRSDPYLLAEVVNITYLYPWVRPPQEVYSLVPTNMIDYTGADVHYMHCLFDRNLTVTLFYGAATSSINTPHRFFHEFLI